MYNCFGDSQLIVGGFTIFQKINKGIGFIDAGVRYLCHIGFLGFKLSVIFVSEFQKFIFNIIFLREPLGDFNAPGLLCILKGSQGRIFSQKF